MLGASLARMHGDASDGVMTPRELSRLHWLDGRWQFFICDTCVTARWDYWLGPFYERPINLDWRWFEQEARRRFVEELGWVDYYDIWAGLGWVDYYDD